MIRHMLAAMLTAAALLAPGVANAEFPDKAITLIVPSTPGSLPSIVAQAVSEGMQAKLGTPVLVVNRPGGNQMIGNSSVVRSPADGYTMGQAAGSLANIAAFMKEPPFDIAKDVKMLGAVAMTKLVLATGPKSEFSDFKGLIEYAKANPGKVHYSSTGADDPRLFSEAMKQQFSLNMVHVPFKGTAEAVTALIAGDIQLVWVGPSRIGDGNGLKPLAVTGTERAAQLPDVPASTELGLNDVIDQNFDMFVPGATPDDVAAKLAALLDEVTAQPDLIDKIAKAGAKVRRESPEETRKRIEARSIRAAEIAQAAGIEKQ